MNHQNNTYTTLKGKYHVNILRKGKPRYPHASTHKDQSDVTLARAVSQVHSKKNTEMYTSPACAAKRATRPSY